MKILRLPLLLTTLATPLVTSGCFKNEDKSNNVQIVKPVEAVIKTKEVIDEQRKALEKQERTLALELEIWSSYTTDALVYVHMFTEDPKEAIEARQRGFKLIRINEDFINETGNNFDIKKPNEDQVEAFKRVINYADKSVLMYEKYINLPLDILSTKIEKYLRSETPKLTEEEIIERKKDKLESYQGYKDSCQKIIKQKENLIKTIEIFNEDANTANQPAYEPVWGLNIGRLKELKSIK